ncbi:phospho-acceptor domain-containing protein [Arcicella aurantiaca]|uniref:histidine kinase n=1 Tax=Arcicella aurantiaca TaxID=591202 RepID=A0A316E3A0_9BACT|nr:sensor histidine kinase [Arcicella aurantiaca]PWK25167.1 phospho-acceptor domain-containing protein [Arcicella aurantiaca]
MQQTSKYIKLSFLGFALLLLGLSWVSFQQVYVNQTNTNAVEHTQKVLLISEEFISNMKDIETGQRGFLLTKNRVFLEPLNTGQKDALANLDSLDVLVKDNAVQKRCLVKIKELSINKIKALTDNISLIEKGKTIDMSTLEYGKKTMDSLRTRVITFQKNERDLLSIRTNSKNYGLSLMPIYQVLLSFASLVLLGISYYFVNTELKRRFLTEKTLEKKVEELNRSNAELEQFAYVASHDLQEPLRKIRAFSDKLQLKQKELLTNDGQETLSKIASSAARMQTLIDDLLNFSRMVNHKSQQIEEVSLNVLVNDVLEELSVEIHQKNANIEVENLPYLKGYGFQIRQLFLNLISNSLKYALQGVKPEISIKYSEVNAKHIPNIAQSKDNILFHKISIIDNGIGFESQYVEKIFIIFQRLHNRGEFQGNGIGLAICKRVMANHHGFIFAKSKPYEGATFDIYFPATTT